MQTGTASDLHVRHDAATAGRRSPAGREEMPARETWSLHPAFAEQQVTAQCVIERFVRRDQQLMRATVSRRLAQGSEVLFEANAIVTGEKLRRHIDLALRLDVLEHD